jgi:hypothetical protein
MQRQRNLLWHDLYSHEHLVRRDLRQ